MIKRILFIFPFLFTAPLAHAQSEAFRPIDVRSAPILAPLPSLSEEGAFAAAEIVAAPSFDPLLAPAAAEPEEPGDVGAFKKAAQRIEQTRGQGGPEGFALQAEKLFNPGLPDGARAAVIYREGGRASLQEFPQDGEMSRRMEISPLTNPEREKAAIELFKLAGAQYDPATAAVTTPDFKRYDQVQVQEAGPGKHNIFVVKKGRTDRVVILGSHVDKVSEGRGTIDNWTGTTMDINAYQALRGVETEATYVFVTFAREEEGLLGSEHFLRSLPRDLRKRVDAMVNLDTLGVDGTFSWKNNSSRSLLALIRRVADAKKLDLTEEYLDGGDADSSTFLHAGIPAMTVFGASPDVVFDIIHSDRDNMAVFSLKHYKNALLLTVALLEALDHSPQRLLN